MQDGKPIERNLKRNRITMDEVAAAGAVQNIGSIDGVKWAVLETSGEISIIPRT